MSQASRRATREAREQHKEKYQAAQQQLRAEQAQCGLQPVKRASVSNRLCPYHNEAEEQAEREAAVEGQLGVLRSLLPK